MLRRIREHNLLVFIFRMMALYIVWGVCRLIFWGANYSLVGPIEAGDVWAVMRGSMVFDSVSILYINLPFILFSLFPWHLREKRWYRMVVQWLYVLPNALGLTVNIADICYYPFKLARIAFDDFHFFGEENFGGLVWTFLWQYWWALLLWVACVAFIIFIVSFFRYTPLRYRVVHPAVFYTSNTFALACVALFTVYGIRGFISFKGTYPVAMSDVTNYVKPQYSSLALSNPFCVIRTLGKKSPVPRYFEQEKVDVLAPVMHQPMDSVAVRLEGQPNVVILILESFGTAHIRAMNDSYNVSGEESCTPNLDAIIEKSYTFTNAYNNGSRSIDALPAIWASIPSFKIQFLSLPQSVAEYYPLPAALRDEGYRTMFFHGAVRQSMSFVAFGQMAGVEEFYSREDYEKEHGRGDFDGHWGIFDHKFLPFVGDKLDDAGQPFLATVFTLSSHHPYVIPGDVAYMFPQRNLPMRRAIAYSDYALGEFMREASTKEWFDNTLFVITADHASGTDNPKYMAAPYNHAVPVLFYYPGRIEAGRDDRVMQHINIAPTLARMLGYGKPLFGFGRDMFNDESQPYAIYYSNSAFNYIADDMLYLYNEKQLLGAYDYRTEYLAPSLKEPLDSLDTARLDHMKAFVQQYYQHVEERRFR